MLCLHRTHHSKMYGKKYFNSKTVDPSRENLLRTVFSTWMIIVVWKCSPKSFFVCSSFLTFCLVCFLWVLNVYTASYWLHHKWQNYLNAAAKNISIYSYQCCTYYLSKFNHLSKQPFDIQSYTFTGHSLSK